MLLTQSNNQVITMVFVGQPMVKPVGLLENPKILQYSMYIFDVVFIETFRIVWLKDYLRAIFFAFVIYTWNAFKHVWKCIKHTVNTMELQAQKYFLFIAWQCKVLWGKITKSNTTFPSSVFRKLYRCSVLVIWVYDNVRHV